MKWRAVTLSVPTLSRLLVLFEGDEWLLRINAGDSRGVSPKMERVTWASWLKWIGTPSGCNKYNLADCRFP